MAGDSLLMVLVGAGLIFSAFLLDRLSVRKRDALLHALAATFFLLGVAYGISPLVLSPEQAWWAYALRFAALLALIGAILRNTHVR
jgi:uncharacterized membrane protein